MQILDKGHNFSEMEYDELVALQKECSQKLWDGSVSAEVARPKGRLEKFMKEIDSEINKFS